MEKEETSSMNNATEIKKSQTDASIKITKLNLHTTPCENDVDIVKEPKENHDDMCTVKETNYFSIKKSLNVENVSSVTTVLHHGQTSNCNVLYVCKICQESSIDQHSFALHMISHTECSMHECFICDQKFSTIILWAKHMKYHQQQVDLNLSNCLIQSPMVESNTDITIDSVEVERQVHKSNLKNTKHNSSIVTKTREPSISNITPVKQELIFHKSTHREPKPFSCKYCDKTFFKKWSWSQHEKIHINEKNKNTVEDIQHQSIQSLTKGLTNHMQLRKRANINYFEEQVAESSNSNNEVGIPNKKDRKLKDRNEECPQDKNYNKIDLVTSTLGTSTYQTRLVQQQTQYNCENCKKGYYLPSQWKKHLNLNKECYNHFKNSTSYKSIQNRANNTKSKQPYECSMCNKSFYSRKNCIRHLKNVHKIVNETDLNTYSIPKYIGQKKKSNTKTNQQNSKVLNQNKHHIISQCNKYKCKDCGKNYSSSSNLCRHRNLYHKINNVGLCCKICNKPYKHSYSLGKHLRTMHSQVSRKNKSIDDEQVEQDIKSVSRISDIAQYLCKICKMEFTDNNALQNHIKVHILNMYECKDCHLLFETNLALAEHIMDDHNSSITHNLNERAKESDVKSSSKPIKKRLKCKICSKVLKSSSYLTIHMKTHANDKRFKCDMCDKTYKFKKNFRMHKRRIHYIYS